MDDGDLEYLLKRLLDEADTGLSRPNSWRMMIFKESEKLVTAFKPNMWSVDTLYFTESSKKVILF
jgi:hypothetical protein